MVEARRSADCRLAAPSRGYVQVGCCPQTVSTHASASGMSMKGSNREGESAGRWQHCWFVTSSRNGKAAHGSGSRGFPPPRILLVASAENHSG